MFVDPETIKLELATTFNLDPDLTSSTPQSIQVRVQNLINNFFDTNLKRFNKVFRRSKLLTLVDALDPSILNSKMAIKIQNNFLPTLNQSLEYIINFPVKIADPDDVNTIVSSSNFTFNGQNCVVKNLLSTNILQIVSTTGAVLANNIGNYDTNAGRVTLTGFKVSSFQGASIKISVVPANQSTIRPLRNFVIDIDTDVSVSSAILDFQNTKTAL